MNSRDVNDKFVSVSDICTQGQSPGSACAANASVSHQVNTPPVVLTGAHANHQLSLASEPVRPSADVAPDINGSACVRFESAWLVSDDSSKLQTVCKSFSCNTRTFSHHAFLSVAKGDQFLQHLNQERPHILVMRLFGTPTASGNRRHKARLWNYVHACNAQLVAHRDFLMFGSARNELWCWEPLQQLCLDSRVFVGDVKYCQLKVGKGLRGSPLGTALRYVTSHSINYDPCTCESHDRVPSNCHDELGDQAASEICRMFLSVCSVSASADLPPESKHVSIECKHFASSTSSSCLETVPELSVPATTGVQTCDELSFPTEARMRQKKAEAKRKLENPDAPSRPKPKRNMSQYEKHKDDCGDDLTSVLCASTPDEWHEEYAMCSVCASPEMCLSAPRDALVVQETYTMLEGAHLFSGSRPSVSLPSRSVSYFVTMHAMCAQFLSTGGLDSHVDLVEICGGVGQTAHLFIRRYHRVGGRVGHNCDIVCGVDLLDKNEVFWLNRYIRTCKPFVVVMSTPCTGMGGWSSLNKVQHHDAWKRSFDVSQSLAVLGGEIALSQLSAGRHFFDEHPQSSAKYQLPIWKRLLSQSETVTCTFHQCKVGLTDPNSRLPVRKATTLVASSGILLRRFLPKLCVGRNRCSQHTHIEGGNSRAMQQWPHGFVSLLVSGIAELIQATLKLDLSYPVVRRPTTQEASSSSSSSSRSLTCPGCRSNLSQFDARHSRTGDCKYKDVESVGANCPGCVAGAPRDHPSHIPEHCRWAVTASRKKAHRARVGPLKSEPRTRHSTEPSALDRLDGTLGEDEEQALERIPEPPIPETESATPGNVIEDPGNELEDVKSEIDPLDVPDTELVRTKGAGIDVNKELAAQRKDRTTRASAGTQADDAAENWSDWSAGKALKLLRSDNILVVRRTLRRLHVRMWHAPAQRLHDLLKTAGVPTSALDEIPVVVDTCPVCRMWARPGTKAVTTAKNITDFNVEVQFDLVKWKQHWICHIICVFLRWSQGGITPSREPRDILRVITHVWLRQYGAMTTFVSDHEGAIDSDEGRAWASRWGIKLAFRPRGAHARIVERHNELLRKQFHFTSSQLEREGVNVPDEDVVDEVFFVKNAMISVNGTDTPYKGLYGRVPNLLAAFEPASATALDDQVGGIPGISRHVQRLREASISGIAQAHANHRADVALNSRTRPAGIVTDLQVGDLVDLFRDPPTKDHTGWRGPAKVCNTLDRDSGVVDVSWQGRTLSCRLEDVRRSVALYIFVSAHHYKSLKHRPWDVLSEFADNMSAYSLVLAYVYRDGIWQRSVGAKKFPFIFQAILHVASCDYHLQGCIGANVLCGAKHLEAVPGVDESLLVWWRRHRPNDLKWQYMFASRRVATCHVFGLEWEHVTAVQFIIVMP